MSAHGHVTRSQEATSVGAAARAARHRRSQPVGWWGMALFIATEAALFGTLMASYFYLRFKSAHWPPHGIPDPKVTLPLILTGGLLVSAIPMAFASRAAQAGRVAAVRGFVLVALLIQGAYLGLQIHLYVSDLDKFSPQHSAYGSIYFTLLGAHHVHVLVGMLLSLWVLARTSSGLTNYRVLTVRVVWMYWLFVSVLGVFVVATQLSPSL